jgi:hypothetical protein
MYSNKNEKKKERREWTDKERSSKRELTLFAAAH